MKDKELREIVYDLIDLLEENDLLYPKKLPPTNSHSLMNRVRALKKCRYNF